MCFKRIYMNVVTQLKYMNKLLNNMYILYNKYICCLCCIGYELICLHFLKGKLITINVQYMRELTNKVHSY